MINTYENQDIEFKQEYVSDINKEVIAFANADGGTILIGVRNNGEVCVFVNLILTHNWRNAN